MTLSSPPSPGWRPQLWHTRSAPNPETCIATVNFTGPAVGPVEASMRTPCSEHTMATVTGHRGTKTEGLVAGPTRSCMCSTVHARFTHVAGVSRKSSALGGRSLLDKFLLSALHSRGSGLAFIPNKRAGKRTETCGIGYFAALFCSYALSWLTPASFHLKCVGT